MTISQLAKSAGVKAETVRFYQRVGLLRTPRRPEGQGFRSYDDEDALHLRFIRRAQRLGFTLEEIAVLLRLSSADCEQVERLAQERLATVQAKIGDLRRLEKALERTISDCEHRRQYCGCPLIEALLAPVSSQEGFGHATK